MVVGGGREMGQHLCFSNTNGITPIFQNRSGPSSLKHISGSSENTSQHSWASSPDSGHLSLSHYPTKASKSISHPPLLPTHRKESILPLSPSLSLTPGHRVVRPACLAWNHRGKTRAYHKAVLLQHQTMWRKQRAAGVLVRMKRFIQKKERLGCMSKAESIQ